MVGNLARIPLLSFSFYFLSRFRSYANTRKSRRILTSHLPAFCFTLAAYVGTLLAVIIFMTVALCSTRSTYISTYPANIPCFRAVQTHQLGSSEANSRTFHVKLNTFGHHARMFFQGTGMCTMIANSCATQAGINTGFVSVIIH